MFDKEFLKDVAERSICTFAEAMLGYVTVVSSFSEVNWAEALSVSGVAFLVTVLKCIVTVKK